MNSKVAIITPSYRNDYELAAALCASVDKSFQGDFEHILIVPQRDMHLFAPLAGPRRKVLAEEGLLKPFGFVHLPVPSRIKIPFVVDMKIREQWWVKGVGRISGWVVQQILKLSAAELTDAELLLFVDSDVLMMRPADFSRFHEGDKVTLHHHKKGVDLDTHRQWCDIAAKLLGIDPAEAAGWNYIGNIIAWRRSNLLKLRERVQSVAKRDWRQAIASFKNVSEYILYGVYCEKVLREASGHVFADSEQAVSVWVDGALADARAIAQKFKPSHVALHIQSTVKITRQERERLVRELERELAAQH